MAGIFVASYALKVYEHGRRTTSPLSFSQGMSLYKAVLAAMENLKTAVEHDSQPHILRLKSAAQRDGRNIWGTLERGEFGYTAVGYRRDTGKDTFSRHKNDAEMLPFHFRFHLPDDEHTGILILQRLGSHSPYTDLRDHLVRSFREANPDFRLDIGRAVPAKVIAALSEGKVKTLKIVTHKKTGDPADSYLKGSDADVGTVEIVMRAKRNLPLWPRQPAWFTSLVTGRTTLAQVYPDTERVQVGVDYKGRTRQFDISNREDAAPYIDITDEVETEDGHPKFDSIDAYCQDLVAELREQLHMGS